MADISIQLLTILRQYVKLDLKAAEAACKIEEVK